MSSSGRVLAAEAAGTGALAAVSATAAASVTAIVLDVQPTPSLPLGVPLWGVAIGAGVLLLAFCAAYAGLRSWAALDLNPLVTVTRLARRRLLPGEAMDRLLAQVVGIGAVSAGAWWLLSQQPVRPEVTTTAALAAAAGTLLLSLLPCAVRALARRRRPGAADPAPRTSTVAEDAGPLDGAVEPDIAVTPYAEGPGGTSAAPAEHQWDREGFDLMPILLATEPFEADAVVREPVRVEAPLAEAVVDEAPLAEPVALEQPSEGAALRRHADLAAFMSLVGEAQPVAEPAIAEPVAQAVVAPLDDVVAEPEVVAPEVVAPLAEVAVEPEPDVVVEPAVVAAAAVVAREAVVEPEVVDEPEPEVVVVLPDVELEVVAEPEVVAPAAPVVASVPAPALLLPAPVEAVPAEPVAALAVPTEPMAMAPAATTVEDAVAPRKRKNKAKRKDKDASGRRDASGVNVTVNVYLDGVRASGRKS